MMNMVSQHYFLPGSTYNMGRQMLFSVSRMSSYPTVPGGMFIGDQLGRVNGNFIGGMGFPGGLGFAGGFGFPGGFRFPGRMGFFDHFRGPHRHHGPRGHHCCHHDHGPRGHRGFHRGHDIGFHRGHDVGFMRGADYGFNTGYTACIINSGNQFATALGFASLINEWS